LITILHQIRCLARYLAFLLCLPLAAGLSQPLWAAADVEQRLVVAADFTAAHEALVEAIEGEGLVVSAVIPYNRMLARTAGDLARTASPYAEAEIVQFCSTLLAWQLIEEDPAQIALCPLSIAIYVRRDEPGQVVLAWRMPGQGSAGRVKAGELLRRLAERATGLARQRW
jgi:uncharacterized protein (DUF302 family)